MGAQRGARSPGTRSDRASKVTNNPELAHPTDGWQHAHTHTTFNVAKGTWEVGHVRGGGEWVGSGTVKNKQTAKPKRVRQAAAASAPGAVPCGSW